MALFRPTTPTRGKRGASVEAKSGWLGQSKADLVGLGCQCGAAGKDAPGARRQGWLRPTGKGGAAHTGERAGTGGRC
jgi:hypothetical protein